MSKQRLKEDKDYCSSSMSSIIRVSTLAILGSCWSLFLAGKGGNPLFTSIDSSHLLWISALCLSALFCDFLQYLVGYWYSDSLFKGIEAVENNKSLDTEVKERAIGNIRKKRSDCWFISRVFFFGPRLSCSFGHLFGF